jgi:hypothetical protein
MWATYSRNPFSATGGASNCIIEIQRAFHWRWTADRAIKTGQERRNKTN